jgi:hypothetical protein
MLMAARILSARTINFDGLPVVMGAETYDVSFSHGGGKIAEKPGEGKRGAKRC